MLKGATCFLVEAGGVTEVAGAERYRAGEKVFLEKYGGDNTPKRLTSNIRIFICSIISVSLFVNDVCFISAKGRSTADINKTVFVDNLLIFVIVVLVEILVRSAYSQVYDMVKARRASREQDRLQSDEEPRIAVSKQELMPERKSKQESEQKLIDIDTNQKLSELVLYNRTHIAQHDKDFKFAHAAWMNESNSCSGQRNASIRPLIMWQSILHCGLHYHSPRFYYPLTDWSIPGSARTTLKELTCFLVVAGGAFGVIVLYFILVSMIYLLLTQIIIYTVAHYKFRSTIKARVERYHEAEKAWFQKDRDTTPNDFTRHTYYDTKEGKFGESSFIKDSRDFK
ncbi:hypothetical protein K435DRAFT_803254 [Dendrothele bispora CBS 962.96]|uniref:Uncharacterized protein n=1 Tax=Dendrothele bispora (strain CBS 962.96) TaxID=1314807 RepID=A0A4S8LIC5_DENBC|nr:hypothetical protein K435DRAFT_803254 [Dendrothele bispora CBS 962.96]